MSNDVHSGLAAVVVFIVIRQYEFAYLMGLVTALQFAFDCGGGDE